MSGRARFVVVSAAILGILFPVLETLRRGFGAWLHTPATMLQDYVAGGLLLAAVVAVLAGWRLGWPTMLAACAYATGMMSSSFWSQLEAQMTGVTWEANQVLVVAVKSLLWGFPLVMTVLSAMIVASQTRAASLGAGARA